MTQFCETALEAVSCVRDGDTVLLSGFGAVGMPMALLDALIEQGTTGLTVVSNNAGKGTTGLAALLAKGQVRKMICTFPRQDDSWVFNDLYRSGRIELEVVPQGTLTERIRAAGAGIGAFYCPTGPARCWPRARRRATSTGGPTCWSTRYAATLPSWARTSLTGWAISSTARPPAASGR